MSRNINREEAFRQAAEKLREQKEKEAREDREFYERITSGKPWLLFKSVVVFCTLMAILTTVEVFFDGPSKKLTENDWKVNRDWEWTWHKILDVEEDYMFSPELVVWNDRVENSLSITYSPIFRTGKKLNFVVHKEGMPIYRHREIRDRSIFIWFPWFQIFLLIPLITYFFKRQSPWFNFARIASLVFVFPGTLLVIFLSLL